MMTSEEVLVRNYMGLINTKLSRFLKVRYFDEVILIDRSVRQWDLLRRELMF